MMFTLYRHGEFGLFGGALSRLRLYCRRLLFGLYGGGKRITMPDLRTGRKS